MGKKGVLLDNGKQAQSSMALYWKASHNKNQGAKAAGKEAPQETIEDRAESNLSKWKMHKQKMISKLYEKVQKKEKIDGEAEKQKQKKYQQQLERDLLEKEMNKNRPINIPGFKNASQLKSKMQFEQVRVGTNDNNKLIPRHPAEELTHEEIVQILREKQAKKKLERAQKQRVDAKLRQKKIHTDMMMEGFPDDKQHVFVPQKKKEEEPKIEVEKVEPEVPQNYFKSQILQKIERGEKLHKKQEPIVQQAKKQEEKQQQNELNEMPVNFSSRFVPRALWQK